MTCAEIAERMGDYVDGSLAFPELQETELHLASCSECREQERQLRALLVQAEALAVDVPPPRDLWPGIAGRLRPRRGGLPIQGYAVVVLAAGLALAALLTARGPHPSGPGVDEARFVEVERQYDAATTELLATLQASQGSLPPETLEAVQRDLRSIDEALSRVRTALNTDPSNAGLNHLLASTHQRKVDTLRRVVRLAAEL